MLTNRAIAVLSCVLRVGCNMLNFMPFRWDYVNFQLVPATKSHILMYHLHRFFHHSMAVLSVYRLLTVTDWGNIPDRQKIMHIIWIVAHGLTILCYVQFQRTRPQIMHFMNALWIYILKHRSDDTKTDVVSGCVIFGGFILFINGPAHGTGMIEIPCTPHFVSSLVFACRFPSEDVEGIISKIPYFLIETYIVTLILFLVSFNWVTVFLGLAWARRELGKTKCEGTFPQDQNLASIFTNYRTCQRIIILLKDSFYIYLTWFPTLLLGLISLLLFATFKLWYIDIHAYLLFPSCALRCFFESLTPLAMAGKVNADSKRVLCQWARRLHFERKNPDYNWLKAFSRSCPTIVCTAGSLYTFENSIVLCTLNNCVQLTTNLLLMSNRKSHSISASLTSVVN